MMAEFSDISHFRLAGNQTKIEYTTKRSEKAKTRNISTPHDKCMTKKLEELLKKYRDVTVVFFRTY